MSDPALRTFRTTPVSFVRRGGRMSEAQDRAWDELSDVYALAVERDVATTSVKPGAEIDPAEVFGREAPLVVEIGSGQGHAVIHSAIERPGADFLAVDVFKAGLARTMLDAEREGVRNLRVVDANAPEVLHHLLPAGSVAELRVFFPDPWHKNKHTKRRLVTASFVDLAARALRTGGILRLATDWEDYALQMRAVLTEAPEFEPAFEGAWAPRFEGRVLTAFERKGQRAGRAIRDLEYRRVAHG